MASTQTLLELRTRIRQLTDTENDNHITDAELTEWVNKGIRVLAGKVIEADPDFYITDTTLTTVAGTTEYDFTDGTAFSPTAANFRSIRGVDFPTGGLTYRLKSYPYNERTRRLAYTTSGFGLPRYRVARNDTDGSGARLLFDIDPGANTYTVHYLPVPTELSADGDLLDGVMGFDDYVIAYAAARVRRKSDEDPSMELADMARVEKQILHEGKHRHQDGMERISRTRRRRRLYHHDEIYDW